jgi:hypothetical protein
LILQRYLHGTLFGKQVLFPTFLQTKIKNERIYYPRFVLYYFLFP